MVQRQDVVEAAIALAVERGAVPSLAEVARAVGLTKQGVLHYFASRAALDEAVVRRALDRVDAEMTAAAQEGRAAETYLRLAAADDADRAAALVLFTTLRRSGTAYDTVVAVVSTWQALLVQELGDPVRAQVVRLVGDGLFAESLLTGRPPDPELLAQLVDHLVAGTRR